MKLKTIREQLLFAADYHYQLSKERLEDYQNMGKWPNKTFSRKAKRDFDFHSKVSKAMDEALKLL